MLVDAQSKKNEDPVELRDSDLFDGLPSDKLDAIEKLAVLEKHEAASVIFREDEPSHDLLVLRAGSVRLFFTEPSGWQHAEFVITRVRPGKSFGWSTLSGQDRMMAQAEALEDCEVYRIPTKHLDAMIADDMSLGHHIMHRLLQIMGRRLRETRTQLRWLLANS